MEHDNYPYEVWKSVVDVAEECQTQRELDVANHMLIVLTGCSLDTIMEKMNDREQAEAEK